MNSRPGKNPLGATLLFGLAIILCAIVLAVLTVPKGAGMLAQGIMGVVAAYIFAYIIWISGTRNLVLIIGAALIYSASIIALHFVINWLVVGRPLGLGLNEFAVRLTGGYEYGSTYSLLFMSSSTTPLFWGLEILIVVGLVLYSVYEAIWKRSYCPNCHAYYGTIMVGSPIMAGEIIGRLEDGDESEFSKQIRSGHFEQAGSMLHSAKLRAGMPVFFDRCPTCQITPVQIRVVQKLGEFQGQQRVVFKTMLERETFDRLTTFLPTDEVAPARFLATRWMGQMLLVFAFLIGLALFARFVF